MKTQRFSIPIACAGKKLIIKFNSTPDSSFLHFFYPGLPSLLNSVQIPQSCCWFLLNCFSEDMLSLSEAIKLGKLILQKRKMIQEKTIKFVTCYHQRKQLKENSVRLNLCPITTLNLFYLWTR